MKRKGFSLIEILLTMVLFVIFSGAVFILYYTTSLSAVSKGQQEEAVNLATEGLEITKNIQYEDFLNLSDGTYYLSKSGATYSLASGGTELIDNFYTREVTISSVLRNDAGQIDPAGDNADDSTKKITVTLSWPGSFGLDKDIVLQEYVTDWTGVTWTQTTKPDFDAGTESSTESKDSDPEIPNNGKVEFATINIPPGYYGSVDVNERAQDVSIVNNILFTAVAKANQGACSVNMTNPASPQIYGCNDVGGQGQGIMASGNYVYVAVKKSSGGLAIVDATNPASMILKSTKNVYGEGVDVDILGNYAYMAVNDSHHAFVIVNVANPTAPFIASSKDLNTYGTGIEVAGNYAYLTTTDSKLRIYDISNPNSPVLKSTNAINGIAKSGYYQNSYLYLPVDGAGYELSVYNVADPANPLSVGNYDLCECKGYGLDIQDNFVYVSVDMNSSGLRVLNNTDPLNLSNVSSVNIQGKGVGIDATASYVYIAVDTATQGVAIVTLGDSQFATSGTFTSKIHDTSSSNTVYKNISWLSSAPPGTSLKFQIRTASSAALISSATFVGSDGTSATYYTDSPASIELDPGATGMRYMQWRAFFTGDGNTTPSLEEVIIKYEN